VDVVFTLISIFASKKVEGRFIVEKYGFILFDERICMPDCLIFADIVISIY